MITSEPCAWHSSPEELAQVDSPDICADCADAIDLQSKQRQFDRVPSYFENRSAFNEYTEERSRKR